MTSSSATLEAVRQIYAHGLCTRTTRNRIFLTLSTTQVIIRESKRQNATYRPHAIKCLGLVAAGRPDLELFEPMCDVLEPIFTEIVEVEHDDSMDVDHGDGAGEKEL